MPETPLSRRYLRIIENWMPFGITQFGDWPDRENCGHFLGGCFWYGQETAACALACAVAAASTSLNEKRAGCSRSDLQLMALKSLRYLCFTHDTGPDDCVRPDECPGRKENCGNKWGERGSGFFKESQCGHVVAKLGWMVMLLGNLVDDETRAMVDTIHEDYAARFADMWPRGAVYINTQMEEDAWTGLGLSACALYLKDHEGAAGWMRAARRWMFYATTTPQDARNEGRYDDESTVREKTHELINALPDYMADNHGMVHPSYTSCPIMFLGLEAINHGLHRRAVPKEAFFNREIIYAQLRRMTDRAGYLHPPQGMDWPYLYPDPGCLTHASASVLFGDRRAAYLERLALDTWEKRQTSSGGRLISLETAEHCHDIQDPIFMREHLIVNAAMMSLFHGLCGDGPKPVSARQFESAERGVKQFPHSCFIIHRHRKGQTSFAWRNNIMALPLNKDGIQTIAPASGTLLGSIEVKDKPDSHALVSFDSDLQDDGFGAALVMDRAQGSVRQEVLFASLPSGTTLLAETWTANRAITVKGLDQGFLRIINETFSDMKTNCRGYRRIYTPGNVDRFDGGASSDPDADRIETYAHPDWINIDGRIGIVFSGKGKTIYHNRHFFPTWWAIADDLVLSRLERPGRVSAGSEVAGFHAMIVPGCTPGKTPDLQLLPLRSPKQSAALMAEGYLSVANFANRTRTLSLSASAKHLQAVPVFSGQTHVRDHRLALRLRLHAGAATLRRARMLTEVDGSVEFTAAEAGPIYVRNTGRESARVRVAGENRWKHIQVSDVVSL